MTIFLDIIHIFIYNRKQKRPNKIKKKETNFLIQIHLVFIFVVSMEIDTHDTKLIVQLNRISFQLIYYDVMIVVRHY